MADAGAGQGDEDHSALAQAILQRRGRLDLKAAIPRKWRDLVVFLWVSSFSSSVLSIRRLVVGLVTLVVVSQT